MSSDSRNELIERFLDGDLLTVDEVESLRALLSEDPALAKTVAREQVIGRMLEQVQHPPIDAEKVLAALPVAAALDDRVMHAIERSGIRPGANRGKALAARRDSRGPQIGKKPLVVWSARFFALAASLAIFVGVWWFAQPPAGLGLQITEVTGEVAVTRAGKTVAAGPGEALQEEDRLAVKDGGQVALRYDGEETRIELLNATAATFRSEEGGKRIRLEYGKMSCSAAPQKKAFRLETPHTVAAVVGTRFSFDVVNAGTILAVQEGAVELKQGGKNVQVKAGETAVACFAGGATVPEGVLPILGTVTVDGDLREWNVTATVPVRLASDIAHRIPSHTWNGPADCGMEVSCGWNDEGLCLAGFVADDDIRNDRPPEFSYEQDCVELFVDGRVGDAFMKPPYTKGAYQMWVRPPVGGKGPELAFNRGNCTDAAISNQTHGAIKGARLAGRLVAGGWTFELLIPWSGFPGFSARFGARLGLQFGLDDYDARDGDAKQPLMMTWQGVTALFTGPQNMVKWTLGDTFPKGARADLGAVAGIVMPTRISTGNTVSASLEVGRTLAGQVRSGTYEVKNWIGNVVAKGPIAFTELDAPWQDSAACGFDWTVGSAVDGVYTVETTFTDAQGTALGVSRRNLLLVRVLNADIARKVFGRRAPDVLRQPGKVQELFVKLAQAARAGDLRDPKRAGDRPNPDLAGLKRVLFVRRKGPENLPHSCLSSSSIGPSHDALCVFDLATGAIETLYETDRGIRDVDLHWDGRKVLFSSISDNKMWAVWEFDLEKRGTPKRISPTDENDVHWLDACYLPNDEIILASTAVFQGTQPDIKCGQPICNLYRLDPVGGSVRQLTFDQDQCVGPAVREDGMVMYTRWEYLDKASSFNRKVFVMMPDGSNQRSLFKNDMVWPAAIVQARPIPGEISRFIAITGGPRAQPVGDLVLFDVGQDTEEGKAAIAFLNDPERRRGFRPPMNDEVDFTEGLVHQFFFSPWPVDGRRFLAAYSPLGALPFQLTLNSLAKSDHAEHSTITLLSLAGAHCMEPIPLAPRPRPPVISDRVDLRKDYGVVTVADVYRGQGLAGVPRGTIKSLRLIEPYYTPYNGLRNPGLLGPRDVRRIVGTVPVETDGSASWKAPANVPLSIQALDAQGQAVAVMRSWHTAMPGTITSCLGCHESPEEKGNSVPPPQPLATDREPSTITPWYGPARGFAFLTEVQPVLDRYCVGCHDGSKRNRPDFATTTMVSIPGWSVSVVGQSYNALLSFVRRPGPESNPGLQLPMEWHADTSDLVQILRKGHYGVRLDADAWDRLITWIDLNVPYHGTWTDGKGHPSLTRRHELWAKYATPRESMEVLPERPKVAFEPPANAPAKPEQNLTASDWPFSFQEATSRIARTAESLRLKSDLKVDLGEGVSLRLVLVPAGRFVMGSRDGYDDEYPQAVVTIAEPFYMSVNEISNAQFARFDSRHESGYLNQYGYNQGFRGISVQGPEQPLVRVNWHRARAFCEWLSAKSGIQADLPSEAQWEWACRAGTATPLWFGERDQPWVRDFKLLDNLADKSMVFAMTVRNSQPAWFLPHDDNVNDGVGVTAPATDFQANAFGLVNMHGNAREWTRSLYRPYPYTASDGREDLSSEERRVVRGGSFYDLPKRATASYRLGYLPWMRPWNVGFRVVVEAEPGPAVEAKP